MIVLNQFQGTEINLTFQHGMRDFILNGKAARIEGKQASVVLKSIISSFIYDKITKCFYPFPIFFIYHKLSCPKTLDKKIKIIQFDHLVKYWNFQLCWPWYNDCFVAECLVRGKLSRCLAFINCYMHLSMRFSLQLNIF